jgi:GWxTD domain-containing protein
MKGVLLTVIVLSGAAASGVGAQSVAQRDSIERLREGLAAVEDSVDLLAREARLIERARVDRDDAFLHLVLGFVAYRLGEVTEGNAHFDAAAGEFEWAAELEPQWPYAWYGLGMSELAMGEHSVIAFENIRQILGTDYLSKATAAFATAAEVDPGFALAVVDLAATAMRQKVRPRIEVALNAVRAAATTDASHVPEILLARARLERAVGSADSSVLAIERYLEVGGDSGIGCLELARSRYFLGEASDGEAAYYAGARLARSEDAQALFREDLGWVATPDELAAFDALEPAGRAPWIREFWRSRDARDARARGERLREHHRRLFYALEHYPLVSRHRRYGFENPYRTAQQTFDDRGAIYVRHGEPDRSVTFSAPDVDPNETWMYARPEGNLVFHFVARGDVQDYKLVESVTDILDPALALRLQAGAEAVSPLALELYTSRQFVDPLYQRLAMGGSVQQSLLTAERRLGQRSVSLGTATDSYALRFAAPLEAAIQRHVVGGTRGGESRLLLVFAVPGEDLVPEATSGGIVYRLHVRVVVTVGTEPVLYLDTASVLTMARALGPREDMHGLLSLPIPPGRYQLRVVLTETRLGAGRVAADDSLDVPDFSAEGFGVSDVVVGRPGSGARWISGGDTVSVTARRRMARADPLQVYYEVHGLAPGEAYRTRLEVRKHGGGSVFGWLGRLFGGGGPPIALSFEGVATGPTTRVLQTVDISDLAPGRYRLRILVRTDGPEEQLEREIDLEIAGT